MLLLYIAYRYARLKAKNRHPYRKCLVMIRRGSLWLAFEKNLSQCLNRRDTRRILESHPRYPRNFCKKYCPSLNILAATCCRNVFYRRVRMRQLIAIVLCVLLPSAVLTQTQTSAVKNSFQEVTSHLDSGGNLYLYLSTEEWLSGLSAQIAQFRNILDAIPDTSAADKQNATLTFSFIAKLVKQSAFF